MHLPIIKGDFVKIKNGRYTGEVAKVKNKFADTVELTLDFGINITTRIDNVTLV